MANHPVLTWMENLNQHFSKSACYGTTDGRGLRALVMRKRNVTATERKHFTPTGVIITKTLNDKYN